ncbi:DUF4253 domain-containing protein [Baekduia sp. Peel2402]|uniref:DUF4253 domain-containing protein n=1 Tax=Baekduia sp. Peel2402 TaxID=3458296 RepID=UPI00403EE46C
MRIRVDGGTAAKAAGIVASFGLFAWGVQANVGGVDGNGAAQSRMCAQLRADAERMPAETRDRARQTADEACENGFHTVPPARRVAESAPRTFPAGDVRPTAPAERAGSVARARTDLPYFAVRIGRLPRDGAATVGGVALPQGSRRGSYWATDAPTPNAAALAARLAKAFPQTGLWPVLWDWEDTPDGYTDQTTKPSAADRVDVRSALTRVLQAYGGGEIGALAAASPRPERLPDPFAQLADAGDLKAENGAAILLVPVHRPADTIAALGAVQTEVAPNEDLTAVARSWEERFGAIVTKAGPSEVAFSIAAPPTDDGQALLLAAEQIAFSPEGDLGEAADLAPALRRDAPGDDTTGREAWFFGWPD